ncbi:hypothetical protein ZOSMA_409G00140 [Zostera marina]|uniref:Uncharacterized protein n=1 Tax=Zostera marina TaxID=29655 RepID=A0A0K9P319_ZOSMR|nr:hypothetical protein ZOSMA_409G00140 [Zostera marina]
MEVMKSQTLSYFGKALSDHAIKQEKLSEFFIFRCIDCLCVRSTLTDQMLGFQSTYVESPPLGMLWNSKKFLVFS